MAPPPHVADNDQGDDISTRDPLRVSVSRLYTVGEETNIRCRETIYTSPAFLPAKTSNASVKWMCYLQWDTEIDACSLPTYTNSLGKVFYDLEFDVEMTCIAGSVDFAVYHKGKRQGSKHVAVDYETRD